MQKLFFFIQFVSVHGIATDIFRRVIFRQHFHVIPFHPGCCCCSPLSPSVNPPTHNMAELSIRKFPVLSSHHCIALFQLLYNYDNDNITVFPFTLLYILASVYVYSSESRKNEMNRFTSVTTFRYYMYWEFYNSHKCINAASSVDDYTSDTPVTTTNVFKALQFERVVSSTEHGWRIWNFITHN